MATKQKPSGGGGGPSTPEFRKKTPLPSHSIFFVLTDSIGIFSLHNYMNMFAVVAIPLNMSVASGQFVHIHVLFPA